jgi:Ca2+-binding RTX toxin-like protein
VIWGSAANENIFGDEGDDTLFGGAGNDFLYGGVGADVFEFTSTSLGTSIRDFDLESGDRIRIYQSIDFVMANLTISNTELSLQFSSGDQINVVLSITPMENFTTGDYWEAIDLI